MNKYALIVPLILFSETLFSAPVEMVVLEGTVELSLPPSSFEFEEGSLTTLKDDPDLRLKGKSKSHICISQSPRLKACLDLAKDKEWTYEKICKELSPSSYKKFVIAMQKAFLYEAESYQGGKRLNIAKSISGFPTGRILRPKNLLVIHLNISDGHRYRNFSLSKIDSEAPIFKLADVGDTISISASMLNFGGEYDWIIEKDGKPVNGTFAVALQEDQENFEAEVESTENYDKLSLESKLVARALKAKEWQFSFDMDLAAKQLLANTGE